MICWVICTDGLTIVYIYFFFSNEGNGNSRKVTRFESEVLHTVLWKLSLISKFKPTPTACGPPHH